MRQRQRENLDPDPDAATLRSADSLLGPAVEVALADLGLEDSDAAAVQLARQYARVINQAKDQAWAYRWIGPELLRVLEALNATPAARSKLRKGSPAPQAPSKLEQLRAARRPGPA